MRGSWVRCLRHRTSWHRCPELAPQTSTEDGWPLAAYPSLLSTPLPSLHPGPYRHHSKRQLSYSFSTGTCICSFCLFVKTQAQYCLRICGPSPGPSTNPGTRRLCYNTKNSSLWARVALPIVTKCTCPYPNVCSERGCRNVCIL